MKFAPEFFDDILHSTQVEDLCRTKALAAEEIAVANAPVKTGAYRDGIKAVRTRSRDRVKYLVIGEDAKTMLVESQTGNLARALKAVKNL